MKGAITKRSSRNWFYLCMSCSEAMFTILNRGSGVEMEDEEQASHALAGGVMRNGHACGNLWGSALASGARAQATHDDATTAAAAALFATGRLADEFRSMTGDLDCRELIQGPLTTLSGKISYVLKGKFRDCERMTVAWAPRAFETIDKSLDEFNPANIEKKPLNCACAAMIKVSESLGLDTQKYAVLPAGFAGGLGLKGNACGALAAGIFALGLKHSGKNLMKPSARLFRAFKQQYGQKTCPDITGRGFSSIDDHSEYMASGGCNDLIDSIARWAKE